MTFLDELKSARQSPISVYQQFLLKNRSSPGCYHVFFEGQEDYSFYYGFLRNFIPPPMCLEPYRCDNKVNVYRIYPKVMSASPQGPTLFFVDKDFSDILNENYPAADNIYVTDYYSIENYLVSVDILDRIWNEIFHFPNAVIDVSTTRNKFQVEHELFYDLILPLTAWIVSLRRYGINPNLQNINLARFFYINSDLTLEKREEVAQKDEINSLDRICGVTTPVECHTMIDSVTEELLRLPPKTYVRGKFELWFFVKFINGLVNVLKRANSDLGGNVKIKTVIHEGNAIELLGPRLQIPLSLDKFLQRNTGI